MIEAIKQFFDERLRPDEREQAEDKVCRLQLASAALLLELMKTDRHIDEREEEAFCEVLTRTFDLDEAALAEISELAEEEARQATSLYEFTSLVNNGYDYGEKVQLVENMWQIAWADGRVDKYEEQMIRKTADLIYVSHSDFIRSKLNIRDRFQRADTDQD